MLAQVTRKMRYGRKKMMTLADRRRLTHELWINDENDERSPVLGTAKRMGVRHFPLRCAG